MTRWAAALVTAAALAACGQKADEQKAINGPAASGTTSASRGQESAPAKHGTEQASKGTNASKGVPASVALGTLPPADATLRFVGTWAANEKECTSRPWRFTESGFTEAGGEHCRIYKVSRIAGGYDLAAQCPGKKPIPTDLVKLRFAESARAMLVESNSIAPTGLIYCGKSL